VRTAIHLSMSFSLKVFIKRSVSEESSFIGKDWVGLGTEPSLDIHREAVGRGALGPGFASQEAAPIEGKYQRPPSVLLYETQKARGGLLCRKKSSPDSCGHLGRRSFFRQGLQRRRRRGVFVALGGLTGHSTDAAKPILLGHRVQEGHHRRGRLPSLPFPGLEGRKPSMPLKALTGVGVLKLQDVNLLPAPRKRLLPKPLPVGSDNVSGGSFLQAPWTLWKVHLQDPKGNSLSRSCVPPSSEFREGNSSEKPDKHDLRTGITGLKSRQAQGDSCVTKLSFEQGRKKMTLQNLRKNAAWPPHPLESTGRT